MSEQEEHMKKSDALLNSLAEHIGNNAECLERLLLIVADALPHTREDTSSLHAEWRKINSEINAELNDDLSKIELDA